jgi:hypothetical protein
LRPKLQSTLPPRVIVPETAIPVKRSRVSASGSATACQERRQWARSGHCRRLQLNQLRGRSSVRWPPGASLNPTAPGIAKSGKPHCDVAKRRCNRMVPLVLHGQAPPQFRQSGRQTTAWSLAGLATNSCCKPASTSFPSASVKPRLAISPRSSGRLMCMTLTQCSSSSAPISTNLMVQATRPPPINDQTRNTPLAPTAPILSRLQIRRHETTRLRGQFGGNTLDRVASLVNCCIGAARTGTSRA